MTNEQLREAHRRMLELCREREEAWLNGEGVMLSARDVLYGLGYQPAAADEILAAIGAAGFNYCLDPTVTHANGNIPTRDVCVWGIDQLRSRLDCVRL